MTFQMVFTRLRVKRVPEAATSSWALTSLLPRLASPAPMLAGPMSRSNRMDQLVWTQKEQAT